MTNSVELEAHDRYALVPIDEIDEPQNAERETMDPQILAELALSIADVGLVEPLVVKPVGARKEVIAGHRRLLASRIAKLALVPCIIKAASDVDPLAILVAENSHREDVNPVEEARFYQRVLEELCENDVDVLCEKVRRNRDFVEGRLLLLHGYPAVADALQERKITLAVAKELNKVKHPTQVPVLLDAAVRQGATARTVMEWRKEMHEHGDFQLTQVNPEVQAADGAFVVPASQQLCFFCDDGSDPHLMVTLHMHKPCKVMVQKALGLVVDNNAASVN